MSFWDVSFTTSTQGTSTPPPQTAEQPQPTLNEEVTEVIGQLERFWGGFRKQGQTVIQAARKDLGGYVSQAQKGLNKQLVTPTSDTDAQSSIASSSRDLADSITTDESSASSSTLASTATPPDPQQQQERDHSPTQMIFTRLQSSLPPDILTTIRDTIPDRVRDPQARKDLAHAAQVRVQDAAARGEELLRGASVFLRDAVRVVPPEQAPSSSSAHEGGVAKSRGRASFAAVASTPATRRGALLRALRSNPAILRIDPAKEERSAVLFATWVETGQDATARDVSRRETELAADDGALGSTRQALDELSDDEFWKRYFFRVRQIDQEDERRKAVLSAGPTDQDEDFSWEDEDEETASKVQLSPSPPQTAVPVLNRNIQRSASATSFTMSPQRSDDSFDIVSSAPPSTAGDASVVAHADAKEASSDGGDDGDGSGDGDGDDRDEEESDWE